MGSMAKLTSFLEIKLYENNLIANLIAKRVTYINDTYR